MKFIVFGLGYFGSSLAKTLTSMGHEVIGVDKNMNKVEINKDVITHTVCLDSTDIQAVGSLPLKESDAVVVAIGEDEGASIMTAALLKQLNAKRIVGRAVSALQTTVMQAMGITEIMQPEQDSAKRLAKRLSFDGIVDAFELSDKHNVVEAKCPPKLAGKTLQELELRKKFNVTVLTTIKQKKTKGLLGATEERKISGVATADTILEEDDILVIFGEMDGIRRMLSQNE